LALPELAGDAIVITLVSLPFFMRDITMNLDANRLKPALLLACALLLVACAPGQTVTGPTSPDQTAATTPSNALPVSDIPIPAGAKFDAEQSLIMGAQDLWLGRIVIRVDMAPAEAYNHFSKGMAAFGWNVITAVQARISSLTFQRGERIAMVQIESASLSGVLLSITVSPRQSGTPEAGRAR